MAARSDLRIRARGVATTDSFATPCHPFELIDASVIERGSSDVIGAEPRPDLRRVPFAGWRRRSQTFTMSGPLCLAGRDEIDIVHPVRTTADVSAEWRASSAVSLGSSSGSAVATG